jgi:hypothetical protein
LIGNQNLRTIAPSVDSAGEYHRFARTQPREARSGERALICRRSIGLPAFLALGAVSLWGSCAAGQYARAVTTIPRGSYYVAVPAYPGPVYYYAASPGYYAQRYYPAPPQAPGLYSYAAPTGYSLAPGALHESVVVVPGVSGGWTYPAPVTSYRPVPSRTFGLEPQSTPAQIAEEIAPAATTPRLGPSSRATWRRGWIWRRNSANW